MSTLTKILIVLLTISSIFLCGIVVTYIGTATNYKKEFENRKSTIDSLRTKNTDLSNTITSLNEQISKDAIAQSARIDALTDEIKQLTTDRDKYQIDLKNAETRIQNNEAIVAANTKTVELNTQLRKDLDTKIAELEALKIKNDSDIKDLTAELVSKNATIDQIEIEKKQLIEEKTQLQNRLDQNLLQISKTSGAATAVTTSLGPVQVAPPIKNLNLEGRITEVQPKNSLASISIGSASGVRDKMKFHVIRGDKFICDIVVFQTDADQASGYFDLVGENQPRAGDIVKTNF